MSQPSPSRTVFIDTDGDHCGNCCQLTGIDTKPLCIADQAYLEFDRDVEMFKRTAECKKETRMVT